MLHSHIISHLYSLTTFLEQGKSLANSAFNFFQVLADYMKNIANKLEPAVALKLGCIEIR